MKGSVYLIPIAIFLGITAFFYAGLQDGPPTVLPSPLIGRPAPAFALEPMDANTTSFSPEDLRSGEPVLVNFWASWCVPCRLEAPTLENLAGRGDMKIYGINVHDEPDKAREFLSRFGNPFSAIGEDSEGRIAIEWGVTGYPETFVVDGDGIIRARYAGALTEDIVEDIILPAAGL
jgi:cytochrome c biogenesis protein CcmG/thiol:disulfide interchange protein DsbE